MLLAPDPRRCAAVAARVGRCLRAAERVSLRASQDRCRDVLRLWPRSRRLRTSRAHALHEAVRLMRVGRRSEERGRAARAMCACVTLSNGTGTSGSISRVHF